MIIAVDLDGTLCDKRPYSEYANSVPDLEAIKKINFLYDEGHQIYIYTARKTRDAEVTANWLNKHNVKYHGIILDKLRVDLYIDNDAKTISEI